MTRLPVNDHLKDSLWAVNMGGKDMLEVWERVSKRIKYETRTPSTKLGRFCMNLYFQSTLKGQREKDNRNLVVVWDVRSSAITYDFIWFLFQCSNFCREENNSQFDLIIYVPNDFEFMPFSWGGYNKFVNSEELRERISSLIIPLAGMFSSVRSHCLIDNAEDLRATIRSLRVFPKFYDPERYFPSVLDYRYVFGILQGKFFHEFPKLLANEILVNHELVRLELPIGSSYITLTLRDYGYASARNTSSDDITIVLSVADYFGLEVILIPDKMENCEYYIKKFGRKLSIQSRIDVNVRVALYSKSILNIFSPSGPSAASLFTPGSRTLIYNWGVDGIDSSKDFYRKVYGLIPESQPFKSLDGHLIWGRATFANLSSAIQPTGV